MNYLNRYLYSTVFLTGAGVLILEIAAVRMLSPYYGSSLYVFSSVLSTILAALSFGYWYGGRRADEKKSIDDLYRIIAIAGLIVLALLLVAVVILPFLAPAFSVSFGPLFFSFSLFFVPAFLLGIVSPYIIKLQSLTTPSEHIGAVVGGTFFWGTMGSILGSIATGFWLIPSLGVQQTILLVSIILISVGLTIPLFIDRPIQKRFILIIVAIALGLGFIIHWLDEERREQYVYASDGLYSSITITDTTIFDRPARIMHRDINNSSAIFLDGTDFVFPYAQFSRFYQTLLPEAENFLLLGGGAFTIPRTLHAENPDLQIDSVEIEPVLYDLSVEYFDVPETNQIAHYPEDARVFLQNTDTTYDVIFGDAFGTDTAIPFHLTTLEFYQLAKERLNPGGILMLNFIGVPKTTRPSLFGSVLKTVTTVFPNTRVFPIKYEELTERQNVVFIARQGDTPITFTDETIRLYDGSNVLVTDMELDLSRYDLSREILLTDDHAPVEWLLSRQGQKGTFTIAN